MPPCPEAPKAVSAQVAPSQGSREEIRGRRNGIEAMGADWVLGEGGGISDRSPVFYWDVFIGIVTLKRLKTTG